MEKKSYNKHDENSDFSINLCMNQTFNGLNPRRNYTIEAVALNSVYELDPIIYNYTNMNLINKNSVSFKTPDIQFQYKPYIYASLLLTLVLILFYVILKSN